MDVIYTVNKAISRFHKLHVIHSNTQNNTLGCQEGGQAKQVVCPSKTGALLGRCLIADMANEFTFDQATGNVFESERKH